LIISRSVLLRMRNVSDKSCRENQNTHFVFRNFFFENRAIYEIMWENILQRGRSQTTMTIWRSVLLRMRNVSDKSCRENQNTHFAFSNFFPKIVQFMRKCEKYYRVGQATDDCMAHALCMLDT